MFTLRVFHGRELYMTHAQHQFESVLQVAVNSLVQVQQQRAEDYRIEITSKKDLYFFAIGPKTQHPMNVIDMEKSDEV